LLLAKSKKVRRRVAKAQRKREERLLASGEIIEEKIPITKQTIDLPANETGTTEGALAAEKARLGLRRGLRRERRSGIKEANFLQGM
jgi:large subunit ribosomal protein L54